MLLELLVNVKILVFCISYKLFFVHILNLVYVVGKYFNWKWNCNVWWNL